MKRLIAAGFILLMAGLVAAPVYAVEHKVTGTLTLDGVLNHNPDLVNDSDAQRTVDYREMALEINTESKVNDKITLFTQIEILDKVLSSVDSNSVLFEGEDDDNIQFEHAWMQIISPIGLWRVGRKEGIKWGTDFYDDGDGTDRVEYLLPIDVGDDKFVLAAVAEKNLETKQSNRDNNKYYITGTYVTKEYKTGVLFGYYPYKSQVEESWADNTVTSTTISGATSTLMGALLASANPAVDPAVGAAALALGGQVATYTPRVEGEVLYIAPYFSGKVGPLTVNAEFGYVTGTLTPKPDRAAAAAIDALMLVGEPDYYTEVDVDMMCYWLELAYPIDKATVELGYAFMSGDSDPALGDDDATNAGGLGQGSDWEKMLILTSDDTGLDTTLGGTGNILSTGSAMNRAGMNLMYLGANYDISDSMSCGGILASATADEAMSGWDDDYGMELDLSFSVKFLGNLEYNATVGYLMAGDFWEMGGAKKADDMMAVYHELVLSF